MCGNVQRDMHSVTCMAVMTGTETALAATMFGDSTHRPSRPQCLYVSSADVRYLPMGAQSLQRHKVIQDILHERLKVMVKVP